jgi:hemin uptake protein HemP
LDEIDCEIKVSKFNKGFIIRPSQADCVLKNSKTAAQSLYTEMIISQRQIESSSSLFDGEGNILFHNKGQIYTRQTDEKLSALVAKQLEIAKSIRN